MLCARRRQERAEREGSLRTVGTPPTAQARAQPERVGHLNPARHWMTDAVETMGRPLAQATKRSAWISSRCLGSSSGGWD